MKKILLAVAFVAIAMLGIPKVSNATTNIKIRINITDNCGTATYYCVRLVISNPGIGTCSYEACNLTIGTNNIEFQCDIEKTDALQDYYIEVISVCEFFPGSPPTYACLNTNPQWSAPFYFNDLLNYTAIDYISL